jgi:hypothetical protein
VPAEPEAAAATLPLPIPDTETSGAGTPVLRTEADLDTAVTRARRAVERISQQLTEREARAEAAEAPENSAAPVVETAEPEIGD